MNLLHKVPLPVPEQRPQLTPQQAAALAARDVSVALSAGAGCGKTFVLTERFLAELQPGRTQDPLGRIVAITFTERAAREMRDRIRAACHAELERCAVEDVSYWLKILRGLDSARISTIHAFCASLLRAHAVDAGVDPQFGVLDGSMSATILRRTVRDAIHALLSDQDEDCMQLVLHYGLDRTGEMIRTLVRERFRADFNRFEQFIPDSLAAEWLRRWHDDLVPRLLGRFAESPEAEHVLRLLRENEPTHAEMQRRCQCLLERLPAAHETDDPLTLFAELRTAAQVRGGGGKNAWAGEEVYQAVQEALKRLRSSIDRMLPDFQIERRHVHDAARFSLMAMRVARRAAGGYEEEKRNLSMLDFDDLLLGARNLLRESPGVCSRAAAGIDFLMIDEFQDTDPVQTEIVRLLCGRRLTTGKLFLVGDKKQSIYRFRRADPEVFAELREELPEQGQLPLSENFRSQPAILQFVNCVFASSMGEEYEPLRPHVDEQFSPTPAIEFLFAADDSPAATDKDKQRESATQRREREAEWIAGRIRQLLADETPRIREKNVETGRFELRGPKLGDVAVLFRTLSNVAVYEEALRKAGLDYYLVGGRAFYAQQEIYDLVNLCSYLDDPDDEVALLGVLRSPFFSFSDDTVCALAAQRGTLIAALTETAGSSTGSFNRDPTGSASEKTGASGYAASGALPVGSRLNEQQQRQVRHAAVVLDELRRNKDQLPLAELLHLAVERTGYDAALLNEFLGRRKLANLRKLIELARQFDRSGSFTMKEFVERMRESVAEQTDEELAAAHPESANVIRLMTIHQAKGLEFPVVVLADMDWSRRGGAGAAHFHPELGPLFPLPARHGETPKNLGLQMHNRVEAWDDERETVRLLYVAMTRAADYLILSAGLGPDRKPTSPWLKLLAERFDLQTGLPAVDPYLGRLSLGDVRPADIPEIRVHHSAPDAGRVADLAAPAPLPLSRFREVVEQADPEVLPATLERLSPSPAGVRQFSVSEIEEADDVRTAGGKPKTGGAKPQAASGGPEAGEATTLGTLVHAVLERINFHRPGPTEPLLDACIRNMAEPVSPGVRSGALSRLQAFLESPLLAELAGARQCFRELDFLLRWPIDTQSPVVATIVGQIDCLTQCKRGRWTVLDYKTGGGAAADDARLAAKYEIQLSLYALAVRQLIGRMPDSVEIVLIEESPRRVWLEFSDDLRVHVTERVDAAVARLRSLVSADS